MSEGTCDEIDWSKAWDDWEAPQWDELAYEIIRKLRIEKVRILVTNRKSHD